ncbi:uncharacterized protein TNCV_539301 [Trichonephila clavipes]|nr:uncharacterized protein TNCV_539301 [Trichonephila clavipes]
MASFPHLPVHKERLQSNGRKKSSNQKQRKNQPTRACRDKDLAGTNNLNKTKGIICFGCWIAVGWSLVALKIQHVGEVVNIKSVESQSPSAGMSEANPQVYVETPLHPKKRTVWCDLWAGGIIGPYFFKNDEGHNVTVNGDRYRAMITNFFIPELNNHNVQELWFQQDGATCHTACATIDLLKDTFGDRLILRFGPVNRPPRSCDLTPLDYFLWGYVKSLVYADKPQTLDHLENSIHRVIADIRRQMLEKSSKTGRRDWTTSEPAVAVICQKSYLKFNATRLSFE